MTLQLAVMILTGQRTTTSSTARHYFSFMTRELIVDVLAETHHADSGGTRRMLEFHNFNSHFSHLARQLRHIVLVFAHNFHIVMASSQTAMIAR